MICPHCRVSFHDESHTGLIGEDADGWWGVEERVCSACKRLVLYLVRGEPSLIGGSFYSFSTVHERRLVRPRQASRPPAPSTVPDSIAVDYTEAALVAQDSPKASAALSRRCLQNILREKAGVKPSSLANEINEVLDSGALPSYISDEIDSVRNIGNVAAHPIKSKNTGEIVPVESGEAEWNLNVIESLFDFYYVQPGKAQQRRDALNKKLTDAGKPPMK